MFDITIKTTSWMPLDLTVGTEKIKNSLTQADNAAADNDDESIKKACSEFESLFISQLLKEMRTTIPKSGFISGGKSEEIYTSMLDAQIAKNIAFNREIGISSLIRSQLEYLKNDGKNNDKNIPGQNK